MTFRFFDIQKMFGEFTALIKKFEHSYIGCKVELNIERIDLDDCLFYYSGVLRVTRDNVRTYMVGNTKHLGNTPLNNKKTLRTMMLSRFIADSYTTGFKVTESIPIVSHKPVEKVIAIFRGRDDDGNYWFEKKCEEKVERVERVDEIDENLGEWEYFDYCENRDDVDVATYGVDDCIIWKREAEGERRFHQKLDEELEKYFFGRVPKDVKPNDDLNRYSNIVTAFDMPDIFRSILRF